MFRFGHFLIKFPGTRDRGSWNGRRGSATSKTPNVVYGDVRPFGFCFFALRCALWTYASPLTQPLPRQANTHVGRSRVSP